VGVKSLSQGSVLNSLLYNVVGAGKDSRLMIGGSILQYTDEIDIYASADILHKGRESLQESLNSVEAQQSL
jgi:hypothetical protein